MSQAALKPDYIDEDEHFRIEQETGIKHEWYDGEVFAMAGARLIHNVLQSNVAMLLKNHLRGTSCHVFGGSQQVQVLAARARSYPDVSIGCPPFEWDEREWALRNPRVIVEVLSPSTQEFDLDDKFAIYRQLESLRDYILVWSNQHQIFHYARQNSARWMLTVASNPNDCSLLTGIDFSLCLADVYEDVSAEMLNGSAIV